MGISEKIFLTIMIVVVLCAFVSIVGHAFGADKDYCIEQTTYTYDDCIVKLQG